jgi:MFS family permease
VVAALALPAFAVWTARTHEPLVPPSLFGHLNIAAANVVTFLVYAGLGAFIVFVPLYLQFLGFTPFESGLALAPSSLVIGVLGPRFGAFADRTGPRIPLAVGSALIGLGMAVILLVGTRSAIWTTGVPGLALFALGLAMVVAPITAAALAFAPERLAGVASGVNQTVARVGGLIAVAVVGVVVTLVFEAAGGRGETPFDRDLDATHPSVTAFRSGMAVAAALALAGALVAALWISDSRPTRRRR